MLTGGSGQGRGVELKGLNSQNFMNMTFQCGTECDSHMGKAVVLCQHQISSDFSFVLKITLLPADNISFKFLPL